MCILQFGSRGPVVKSLQIALNLSLLPCPNLVPGETFDNKTRDAVVQFQRSKGLTPNGVVDQKTWTALAMSNAASAKAASAGAVLVGSLPPRPQTLSFQERVAAFLADVKKTHGMTIPQGSEFRKPEDAQKWHVAHMIYFNSFKHQKPAKSELVAGHRLIAWSHLSDPKTPWENVRWQDFLRDADGNVPVKQGETWSPGHSPDEEQTRKQAYKILEAVPIGPDEDRPSVLHSAMVACGYTGCGEPCKCGGKRSRHITGAASDLGKVEIALLETKLKKANAGTLDAYLNQFGLYRPMDDESWHVEATTP